MKKRGSLIVVLGTILVLVAFIDSASCMGSSNPRLGGFGGVGIAVTPRSNLTPLHINPAAPGRSRVAQIVLSSAVGGFENDTYYDDTYYDDISIAFDGEVYVPLNSLTLFGSIHGDYQITNVRGSEYGNDEDVYRFHESSIGLAGTFGDGMLSIGGEAVSWMSHYNIYDDDFETEYLFGPKGYLRGGFIIRTSEGLNLAATYSGESKEIDSDIFTGVPETIRAGLAFQPPRGQWLIGCEYIHKDDLEYEGYTKIDGMAGFYWYAETSLDSAILLRGGLGVVNQDEEKSAQGSLGVSLRFSKAITVDLFSKSIVSEDENSLEEYYEIVTGGGMTIRL